MSKSNLETLRTMYEAFGRGDIESVIANLSESVEWEYGAGASEVPWLQTRHGRDGAREFFRMLALIDITEFRVKGFFEADRVALVLLDATYVVKATGRTVVEEDEVQVWHFDEAGKVVRFRHRVDTHAAWAACTAAEPLRRAG